MLVSINTGLDPIREKRSVIFSKRVTSFATSRIDWYRHRAILAVQSTPGAKR